MTEQQSVPPGDTTVQRVPGATYRLQFNEQFTFQQATAILDYLAELGISDCYASPLFQPRPGSTHGYDVCCFNSLNRALGSPEEFETFVNGLKTYHLGLLLDIVPNHMGADLSNQWWFDVLENGPSSQFASYFDINWEPCTPGLERRLLLPVLGNHVGEVIAKGELKLAFTDGALVFDYYGKKFPASLASYQELLSQMRSDAIAVSDGVHHELPHLKRLLRELCRSDKAFESSIRELLSLYEAGAPGGVDRMNRLLDLQHYRLAFWRVGSEEINYRRFFDVTELVSVKMESSEVFEAAHRLLSQFLENRCVTGLRVDHPDGLWDPKNYFSNLQRKYAETTRGESKGSLYVLVEKILCDSESLPSDWPVSGTTGYEFLNQLNGLFVHSSNEPALKRLYNEFSPRHDDFDSIVYRSKKKILTKSLVSEVKELTHRLRAIAVSENWRRDYTFSQLHDALVEVIACFPVYRTYATEESLSLSEADQRNLRRALSEAEKNRTVDGGALQFIGRLLALQSSDNRKQDRAERAFVLKFQQLTGPATAKGIEDTSFYIYNRLVSLNEVGGAPERFGVSVAEFHKQNGDRARSWPNSLLATATHDTKRGEDVRARINVLSELPDEWRAVVGSWREMNDVRKNKAGGASMPDGNDEYMLYQTLVGAFPVENGLADFEERITAYMLKAIKEAKEHTSWVEPDTDYEEAMVAFIRALFADKHFLGDLQRFANRIAFFGRLNSLSQTLLKLTCPGVPDIYQGCELWDLSLVDPDNRRLVDFALRKRFLREITARASDTESLADLVTDLLGRHETGEIKMFTLFQTLRLRNEHQELFKHGDYLPLASEGLRREHLCAFARTYQGESIIVVVPRLWATLLSAQETMPVGAELWADTAVQLPDSLPAAAYRNIFTGECVRMSGNTGPRTLLCRELFGTYPLALLKPVQ